MPDEQPEDDVELSQSFGWTTSRATRMYFVRHAPLRELLEHFAIEPLPNGPPAAPNVPS